MDHMDNNTTPLTRTPTPPPASIEIPKIPVERMLTTNQVAAILNVSAETLKKWRQRRQGLTYACYSDGAIRYRLSDIMKFLEDSTVN